MKELITHNSLITLKNDLGLIEQRLMLIVISQIDSMDNWDGRDGKYDQCSKRRV